MTSTRPSFTSTQRGRRRSGFSVTSAVEPPPPDNGHPAAITEEINEIKRYEDFTTIDWVQDAIHEQASKKTKRREGSGFWDRDGAFGWRRKVSESYDAGQAWLVITLVGAAIGLNSALLNIITEWLSDVKLGHCTTAFYLNEQFCCWGSESGMCAALHPWTRLILGRVSSMEALDFHLAYQLCLICLLCGTLSNPLQHRSDMSRCCSPSSRQDLSSHFPRTPLAPVSRRSNASLPALS